jgi:ankyrin repeat protein
MPKIRDTRIFMQEKRQLPDITSCKTTRDAFNLISSLSADDIIQQDSTGATILHHLCFGHKIEPFRFDRKVIMEKIIEKNRDVLTLKSNGLDNPIQLAIKEDDVEAVAILVPYYNIDMLSIQERQTTANDKDEVTKEEVTRTAPLAFALRRAQLDMVNCLYTAGFEFLEGLGDLSKYKLDYPKKENLQDLYKDLLIAGKKEELEGLHRYLGYYKGYSGQSSLELVDALRDNNEPKAWELISQGHYIYNDLIPSLFLSGVKNAIDFIFLRTLAHPNYTTRIIDKDQNSETLLRFAISHKHFELAIKLIEAGADVNTANNNKYTLLHQAVRSNRVDIVEKLLKLRADIDKADENQLAAIHLAARFGNLQILKRLLDHGEDVNKPTNHFKDTPLHLASKENHFNTVCMLLQQNKIDALLKNKDGKTALDVTINSDVRQLIKNHIKAKAEQTRLLTSITTRNTDTAVSASSSTAAVPETPTQDGAVSLPDLLAHARANRAPHQDHFCNLEQMLGKSNITNHNQR